jgi:hypothetical protein
VRAEIEGVPVTGTATVFAGAFQGGAPMAKCEVCGNSYDKTFEVIASGGARHVFDSFECAIHALAPHCDHCGCRIVGHGMEATRAGKIYCCASCAQMAGQAGMTDRV